jgi:hypothetical protein
VLTAAALFASGASAQARPDFSGRWTTAPEAVPQRGEAPAGAQGGGARGGGAGEGRGGRGGGRGARAADLGSGWGSTITITQAGSRLTVDYAYFGRGDMQPPLRFHYALDGSETKNSVMMGRGIQEQVSTAAWAGDTLVITTRHGFENPETGQPATAEVRRRLWLEAPASLVVETTRSGVLGGPPSTSRTVYRKL